MAFLAKPRKLPDMYLCGNPLPWVDNLKHLGTMVTNKIDGGQLDIKQKIARYIDKNCTLNQEFHYTHPTTKISLNSIYNCHFSGSQLWNLFSQGAGSFEGSYNRSVKIMADLPYQTHRYMIEPLTGDKSMKLKLIKDYLGFISRIRTSSKPVLKQLYSLASNDVRTVTGSNLRNILLLTSKTHVDELQPSLVNTIEYNKIEERDLWRVNLVKELIDLKHGDLVIPDGWTEGELDMIMNFACTQ